MIGWSLLSSDSISPKFGWVPNLGDRALKFGLTLKLNNS